MSKRCVVVRGIVIILNFALLYTIVSLLSAQESIGTIYDSSFLRPIIREETYLLNLEESTGSELQFAKSDSVEFGTDFALKDYSSIKRSFNSFFTAKEREGSFFKYSTNERGVKGYLKLSLVAGADYHSNTKESYLNLYRGIQLRSELNNRLLFWGDWWSSRFQGDLDFAEQSSPLIKGFYKPHGPEQKYTNVNRLVGEVIYLSSLGEIAIGRGTHLVGNSISGSVILNDDTNDYGYFRGDVTLGKFRLSLLHASIIPDNVRGSTEFGDQDRFLVLHQIDFRHSDRFSLFFGEEIVYANRSIDPSYLLPHTFYRITEHNLGDRDNVLIYCGGYWKIVRGVELYGNVVLDELKKSEIFGDWWGNKYALQGGASFKYGESLFDSSNRTIRTTLEVTAVRPWMYTHKYSSNSFSNDGIGLGYPSGSNLVQFSEESIFPFLKNFAFSQSVSYYIQGSLGNSFSINYNDRPSDTAKWLEGERSEVLISKNVFTYNLSAYQSIKLGAIFKKDREQKAGSEFIFGYRAVY